MHKIWAVMRREFLEKVRTRAFVIGTVLFPVLMIGLTVLPILLDRRETEPKRVAVVDGASGDVGMKVTEALAASRREGHERGSALLGGAGAGAGPGGRRPRLVDRDHGRAQGWRRGPGRHPGAHRRIG